ncbi:glycosyltransferase family 2 protein [Aureisphaera sp. CAU 1614]|uniref:Glycosyltransferase family 2 protein n=1 Tax=Halomarinibacterium sedimenti TaxID=2857106 RepID=A0A9X1JV88_9FLAO|nr:glycosyltransferase family A protein [Halomarinibacterium sedimenti]MBW2937714.1 glycosyltransferase family 2 protein [Halomarinibacterium sedimenti]
MPLVSIIIPTYNRPEMLRLTLDSLGKQTFLDYEIIVVDDGTANNLNKLLCEQYNQVYYFKIENSGGPSKPRNFGIKKSKGKYLAFVDDDDLWLPQKLEKQVAILEDHPNYGIVHCPCKVINTLGEETSEIIGKPKDEQLKHGDVSLKMIGRFTLMTSSVLIRKTVVDAVGNFNEQMPQVGEDTHFWTRCSFNTKFYYLSEPLVLYRIHDSMSKRLKGKYFELPYYLNEVLNETYRKGQLSKSQYLQLRNNIIGRQLKEMPTGKIKTFIRLFKLYPFWFLNFENVKIFIRAVMN